MAELRKRNYEGFSKLQDAEKAGETEDATENEEEAEAVDDTDTRDFDYLLGVSARLPYHIHFVLIIISRCPSGRLHKSV